MSRTLGERAARGALPVVLAAVMSALSAGAAGAREVCPRSERLDSLVSVRFERFAETQGGEPEALLRLVNGSSCGLFVRVLSAPVVVAADGRARAVEHGEELPDGARAALDYAEHRPQLTGTVEPPAWGGGCVVDLRKIPAGRSVLFRVPVSRFRLRYNIAVPFFFAGEERPQHQTFFYWSALPES